MIMSSVDLNSALWGAVSNLAEWLSTTLLILYCATAVITIDLVEN